MSIDEIKTYIYDHTGVLWIKSKYHDNSITTGFNNCTYYIGLSNENDLYISGWSDHGPYQFASFISFDDLLPLLHDLKIINKCEQISLF